MAKNTFGLFIFFFCLCFSICAQSSWTQRASFPGVARHSEACFSIGHYGFVGCGNSCSNAYLKDFLRYDANTNTWSSIANYPGQGQFSNTFFSIEGKGYVGWGWNGSSSTSDLWRYDTISNSWKQMASFPGTARYSCFPFVIGHKAYFVGGCNVGPPYLNDVWVYDAHQNTWKQLNNFPQTNIESCIHFAIGNHGYAGDGYWNPGCYQQMYEYDTTADTWKLIAPIPASYDIAGDPHSWVIGSKAYVVTGSECTSFGLRDGWIYDTVTKSWCDFNYIGGSKLSRGFSAAFTIGNRGFICNGLDTNLNCLADLWEYTPSTQISVSDTNLCIGDSVHFTSSTSYNASSWNWSFPGGSPAFSNKQNPHVHYNNSGTFNVKLILTTCGGNDTVTRNITVISGVSNAGIKGKSPLCVGKTDTITASGGGTYLWSNNATSSAIIVTPLITTIYSVRVTNGGCTVDTSITISVKQPFKPSISAKDTICSGNNDRITATGGGSYHWSNGATTSSIVVYPDSNITYSVQVTNGCTADTNITIHVQVPIKPILSAKDTVCSGGYDTIKATGGGTYLWSNGSTTSSIYIEPSSNTTYSVVITNGVCVKDTAVTIFVNPLPSAFISGKNLICKNDSVTLVASGGGTYLWSNSSTTKSIIVSPVSNTIYTVKVTKGGCSKDTSILINVKLPFIATINAKDTVCLGVTDTLTASGGGTYLWNTGSTSSSILVSPSKDSTYRVIVSNGCIDTVSKSIFVVSPGLYACCDTIIYIAGTKVTLHASGETGYYWTPPNGVSCENCPNPIVSPTVTTTYTVVGYNSFGCEVEKTLTVEVSCLNPSIPNIFTPNGDAKNDEFVIDAQNVSGYSIGIYDRWGRLMYQSTNPYVYWNGKNQNDNTLVSDGVYYYIVKYTCGSESYKRDGFVEVVK